MIEVRELRKEYKTGDFVQRALDGISVTFRDNEFVAVLGPSGSGKTTLLNILGIPPEIIGSELYVRVIPSDRIRR